MNIGKMLEMSELSIDQIRHALETARELGCHEVEIEKDGLEFSARFDAQKKKKKPSASSIETAVPTVSDVKEKSITSPAVGYYQPGKVVLTEGAKIQSGDLVAVISALGWGTDLESSVSGTISQVLVEEGQAVEYGQVLALVTEGS